MIASKRKMEQSPIEIGIEETVPYTLTVPASWGVPTSPSGVVKDADGDLVTGVISGISATLQAIGFTVDGAVLTVNNDYRIEIKFDISGGTLEAWGIWRSRE